MSTNGELSNADVQRLLSDKSDHSRAEIAPKLARQLDAGSISGTEYQIALDILQLMAQDAAVIVRRALAVNLKTSKHLPRSLALNLAKDIDEVALPVLESFTAFTDEDLIALVREVPETKQLAIARRSTLSEQVTEALVETDNRSVVKTVVANEGAAISEGTFNRVIDKFGDDEEIQAPLVLRKKLPVTIAERLVARVSDEMRDYLMTHHELSPDTASELMMQARERATVNLAGPDASAEDVDQLVEQLAKNGRLSPTLIFRALCLGDMAFFETALAKLADIPLLNARTLVHDPGQRGFKSLYQKAKMPDRLYPAMRAAVDIALATDPRDRDYDRESFGRTVLERVLSTAEDLRPDDAEYLLRKLDDLGQSAVATA